MVKINRTYSIDEELVKMLAEKSNASEFICNLLRAFVDEEESENIDRIRLKKQDIVNDIEILNKKVEHLTEKENAVLDKKSRKEHEEKISKELLSWKKEYSDLNDDYDKDRISFEEYEEQGRELELKDPRKQKV